MEISEISDGVPGDIDLSMKEFRRWSNEVMRLTDELNAVDFFDGLEDEPF